MSTNYSIGDLYPWVYHPPLTVQFWLFFSFLIPSILSTLFLLFVLLSDRNLRRALNNHIIIVLLCTGLVCEITVYPWMLYYRFNLEAWFKSPTFCSVWGFIDLGFYFMQLILFAWASFERHILIFHDRWLATKRQRFFLHYLPIILIIFYCCTFYGVCFFFPPCENSYDYSVSPCVLTCVYEYRVFETMETLMNNIIPNFIIIILSTALLFRILQQKRRMRQALQWRKHRKMTIQLLSISSLYLFVTFPYGLMSFLHLCGLPYDVAETFKDYGIFVSYYAVLLFPFISMFSVPECWMKMKRILGLPQRGRRIGPVMLPMNTIRTTAIMQRNI